MPSGAESMPLAAPKSSVPNNSARSRGELCAIASALQMASGDSSRATTRIPPFVRPACVFQAQHVRVEAHDLLRRFHLGHEQPVGAGANSGLQSAASRSGSLFTRT
jgi:hypothetical protein